MTFNPDEDFRKSSTAATKKYDTSQHPSFNPVKLRAIQRQERLARLRLVAEAHGGSCLSTFYIDNRTKLRWRCALKHEWEAIPFNVLRGHWCRICGNERQGRLKAHSIEMMRRIAAARGGECVSQTYKNNLTPLRWRCKYGHEWNAVPGSIVRSGKCQGTWCPICAGKLPKDVALENLKRLAIERGGALVSSSYQDARTALRWRCAKGHEWQAVPDSVKRGTWCPVCGGSFPLTLAKMQDFACYRGGQCLSTDYVNSKTHLRWKCAIGHEWTAKPDHILAGHWCPMCAGGISERICRAMLETMIGVRFSKVRPSWLRSKHGKRMELDGYAACLGLAFEFQGEQHYRFSPFFHENERRFAERQKYDQWKRHLCQRKGITFVEIPYHVPRQRLQWYLLDQLDRKGFGVICDKRPIEISELKLGKRKIWEELRALAVSRGGRLLSEFYVDTAIKLLWRCKYGHEWQASPASVRRGSWCGICGDKRSGRKRAHTIEEMKQLAANKGGLCLSASYNNHKSRLRWRCAANHEWETQASVILSGHWCPKCQRLRSGSRYALPLSEIQRTAAVRGGACLSTDYLNNRQKLTWQCSNGHTWNANANSVRGGSWCPSCANSRRSSNMRNRRRAT
jgi:hypothetical protein